MGNKEFNEEFNALMNYALGQVGVLLQILESTRLTEGHLLQVMQRFVAQSMAHSGVDKEGFLHLAGIEYDCAVADLECRKGSEGEALQ